VYRAVIERERHGDFLGKTVQIVPHIVAEIHDTMVRVAEESESDVCLVEMGGTVGDIESMPFIEAVRQLRRSVGSENTLFVHTTLVPVMGVVGEQKTKPTQHSVKELKSLGIQPDLIVCRGYEELKPATIKKISMFCDVPEEGVISAHDVNNVFQVPLLLDKQGLTNFILRQLKLDVPPPNLEAWTDFVNRAITSTQDVTIALVGKYTGLKDSYLSHLKAMEHTGAALQAKVHVKWVEAEDIEEGKMERSLGDVDGILIPGGFGHRGTDGKIFAAGYARENGVPFLGICLGFQTAVIDFARGALGLEEANSSEMDPKTPHPVIDMLPELKDVEDMGATMRLGAQDVDIQPGSLAAKLYGAERISERHRHRREVNPDYIGRLEEKGLKFTGRSLDGRRMEIAELADHPFFIATQYHPEFKSRPYKPAPLYKGFVEAAVEYRKGQAQKG
jgi:CTP synthase